MPGPMRMIVVMGVSGCGKTVVSEALAERLGWTFIEGDALHPPENVARMAGGQPLTDADRAGWLDAIGRRAAASLDKNEPVVVACSALKRAYRDRLRAFVPDAAFICLDIDKETARRRVGRRKEHFMPASLVDSQFATLERPGPDEAAAILDGTRPLDGLIEEAAAFGSGSSSR